MVDSRAKGARTETAAKDILKKATGLSWERVPASGALDPKHGLKGDLYVVGVNNVYCIEVKGYADDALTSSIFTAKNPTFIQWWEQTIREAGQTGKLPMLIFKYDRSKFFVAVDDEPNSDIDYFCIKYKDYYIFVYLLEDYLHLEKPNFT